MNVNPRDNYQKHKERHGFPRHPGGTVPGRVPVFLHGGNPQEAYTMPHAYFSRRVENNTIAKTEGLYVAIIALLSINCS